MPAYIIARVAVADREQYRHYLEAVPPVIGQFGGKVIARSEKPITLEGDDEMRRIVILQFPDLARAQEFYHSPEYQKARNLRAGAATGELIAIAGIAAD